MPPPKRILGAFVLAALGLIAAAPEARADGAAECVKGSEDGIAARDKGRLRDARKDFVTCAADVCPKSLRIDCARWLEEVDQSLPTVVFGAHDASGGDVFDVGVFVDGERVTGHEQGKAVALDPGPHVVRFEHPPSKPATVKVLLRAGEHNRQILATFGAESDSDKPTASPATATTPETLPPRLREGTTLPPTPTIVLGAVGVLALGSFAFFGVTGNQEKTTLRNTCGNHCTDDQVSPLKTKYILADVSLGVGIVALGLAAYFWLTDKPATTASAYGRFARTIWK